MHSKDVESVVDTQDILELGTVVASGSADNTKDNGRPSRDKARGRGDGNEAGNNTGAETNGRPLLLQTVIKETPGDTADGSSQVGNDGSHNSTQVSAQGGTSIESEPSNPQEDGTDDDVGDVVRAVVELVSSMAATLAQHERVGEGSSTRRNVHRGTAGKVKTAQFEYPARCVPRPACNRIVDDGGPDEHEDDARQHAATFGNCTDREGNTIGYAY